MVAPDGDRSTRLPTMSWESVVDAPAADTTPDVPASPPTEVSTEDSPLAASPSAPLVAPSVHVADLDEASLPLTPEPTPVGLQPMSLTSSGVDVGDGFAASDDRDELNRVRVAAPSAIIPMLGDVEVGPSDIGSVDDGRPAENDLPPIVEVIPVDTPDVSVVVDPITPTLPPVMQPDQRAVATPSWATQTTVLPVTEGPHRPSRRRRSRRGPKLFLAFVVLAGLVAAGVVFGRPYLFPEDWDATAAPYAEAIEIAREETFVEPLAVVAESSGDLAARATAELVGSWEDVQPMWRALGLTTAAVTPADITEQLTGWQEVVYSTDDGQVYHDAAVDDPQHDALITQAMVAAALDQDFGWSSGQPDRTLDDQAAVSAEVLRQAREIQSASTYDASVDAVDPAVLDGLPSVVAYRALAPYVFAEFSAAEGNGNALADVDATGVRPIAGDEPGLAAEAVMVGGDIVVTAPVAMDRSFWFLTFAGFIDSRTAYVASEAIVDSSVVMAERDAGECAYATFSGGGVEETAVLRDALEQWVAAAPPEFGASFSVLDDGTLQLLSCDPGPGFRTPVNAGAHWALLGWRVAELATIEAVRAGGSTDLETDVAAAWPFVGGSSIAEDLAALPSTTTPAELADAGRATIAAIFTPQG